jgi:hypothetical protein
MDLKKVLSRTRKKLLAIKLKKKRHKLDVTFDDIPFLENDRSKCPYGLSCALISDPIHQRNFSHEYLKHTGKYKDTADSKYKVHVTSISKVPIAKSDDIQTYKVKETDVDDKEQKKMEEELNERLEILAKRRYERLGITTTNDVKARNYLDGIGDENDTDEDDDLVEKNDDDDGNNIDGEDTFRSSKYTYQKKKKRELIILQNSPYASPKEIKNMMKIKNNRQNNVMNTIVETTKMDPRTEEEKECENKFILKRILKERDFMARISNANDSSVDDRSLFGTSKNFFGGSKTFRNMFMKTKENENKKYSRKNNFDEIRIAMRFWLNLTLRKSMNSWIAYTYRTKQIKKLMHTSIEIWGIRRQRYGFSRWYTNTRIIFDKKTFLVENGDIVTVLIRKALFETPQVTRTILSTMKKEHLNNQPLLNTTTGVITIVNREGDYNQQNVTGHVAGSNNVPTSNNATVDNTNSRKKNILKRQNAVSDFTGLQQSKEMKLPIKYDRKSSIISVSPKLSKNEQKTAYHSNFTSPGKNYSDENGTTNNTVACNKEKDYMPVLRRLYDEYKIKLKREQYKSEKTDQSIKQILYGYMKDNDVTPTTNII